MTHRTSLEWGRVFGLWVLCVCSASTLAAERIVSLAPHLTELAFTAGAGSHVVATVEYSDAPDAARRLPRIGDAFRVDYERLLALRPDLVLAWEVGTPARTVERVRSLGLKVAVLPTRGLGDVASALRQIGAWAGTQPIAEQAAAQFERELQQLRDRFSQRRELTVFIQVDDQPLYTVNGEQMISEIVALCGGRNVFADLKERAPAVSFEAVLALNPQVILSTDPDPVAALAPWRPWRQLDAVKYDALFALHPDDVVRATPRVLNGAREICRSLETARSRLP